LGVGVADNGQTVSDEGRRRTSRKIAKTPTGNPIRC
jgi:hypothetical protein